MSFSLQQALTLSSSLLVLDGIIALLMGGLLSLAGGALLLLAVAGSWWAEWLRARSAHLPAIWRALTVAAAAFAVFDLAYLAESLLDGFVHLLLFLTCYKLYNRQTVRDTRDLFFLAFFMLVAASAMTVSVGFVPVLVVFLVLGIWTFVLYHLLAEMERHAPEQMARLPARRLVTPSFVGVILAASGLTLAFTLVFFFVIPRMGQAAIPLRARTGKLLSGFSDRVKLGSFGSIQTDPSVVMRIRFPDGTPGPEVLARLRWRGVAFDYFTGQEWVLRRPDRKPAHRDPDGRFVVAAPRGGPLLSQEVYLEPVGADVVFAVPRLLAFNIPPGLAVVDSTESVGLFTRNTRLRYLAYSELEPLRPRRPPAGSAEIPEEVRARYLQLPALSPRVGALAREVTRRSRDPYEAALALTEHLRRSLRYTLDLRRDTDLPPVEEFLFVTRAGNCEYFASGLTVLLRSMGIPARVVNGFQRGEWNTYGQYVVVRQRDAHSWVEAYLPGHGWLTLDPSPRAEVDAAFATSQLSHYLDTFRMRWYRYIVNWSLTDQVGVAAALHRQALAWRRGLSRAWDPAEWVTWGRWLLAAGAGAALFLLLARVRRGGGLVSGPRSPTSRRRLRAYEEMLKRLARLALAPGPSETAREFAGRAALARPPFAPAFREITEAYERVRFGDGAVSAPEERRLLALVESLSGGG